MVVKAMILQIITQPVMDTVSTDWQLVVLKLVKGKIHLCTQHSNLVENTQQTFYRGSPFSTNSLSTISSIVRFQIVLNGMDSLM